MNEEQRRGKNIADEELYLKRIKTAVRAISVLTEAYERGAMIIIRKDNEGGVPITEVLDGAVFDYLGDVYMKISDRYKTYNAVYLESGMLTSLNVNVVVTPLEAELIIRGKYNAD